jgi:hypothetical protein
MHTLTVNEVVREWILCQCFPSSVVDHNKDSRWQGWLYRSINVRRENLAVLSFSSGCLFDKHYLLLFNIWGCDGKTRIACCSSKSLGKTPCGMLISIWDCRNERDADFYHDSFQSRVFVLQGVWLDWSNGILNFHESYSFSSYWNVTGFHKKLINPEDCNILLLKWRRHHSCSVVLKLFK